MKGKGKKKVKEKEKVKEKKKKKKGYGLFVRYIHPSPQIIETHKHTYSPGPHTHQPVKRTM